ncbi:MAG: CHAT domain-containing protein [Cyclobacteriaceae bacterium]|nr:CHAT domain-containing protein [Cyclobacteriaceae bacterium]
MKLLLTGFLLLIAFTGISQSWLEVNSKSIKLYKEGSYQEAITMADEALNLAIHQYGKNTSQYIASLTNKAYAQSASGDYLKAIDNFRIVANLSFTIYQLPHISQIESLCELTKTFGALASYDSAEHYLNLARYVYIAIPKQNKPHSDTSTFALSDAYITINNLDASLHYGKGQVSQAIELLETQATMLKDLYPDDYKTNHQYQITINNLFTYNNEILDIAKAEKYAREYYNLIKNNRDSLNLIHALQNLGSVYNNRELYDSAEYFWGEALEQVTKGNYKGSYIHTVLLNNLGTLKLTLESYDSAIAFLSESLRIQNSHEAVQPDLYKTTLFNLAESYHWQGNYAMADSIYTDLIQDLLDDIIHNFTYLSDNEKLAFYKNQAMFIEHYKFLALSISGLVPFQDSDDPYINREIPGRLFDLQLTTKAIILNASKRMKNTILKSGDTTVVKIYELWQERKNQLARALIEGKKSKTDLYWLNVQIEENEKWLTANSRSFKSGFQFEKISWRQIQKTLKPNEAAVEIIRLTDGLLYGALIITPETTKQPVLSLIKSTKSKHLEQQYYKNYYNSIITQQEDTVSHKTYWRPIIDSIKNHMPFRKIPKRIYVSNDGIYNQINLNTLRDPSTGCYVLDETDLVVVTNTKELLIQQKSRKKGQTGTAALFGRPQFSNDKSKEGRFKDLPGTGKEVELLNKSLSVAKWSTQVFTAQEATEENLKNLDEPTVLHLASHGFFNPDTNGEQYSLVETMIRSGIALAGVNDVNNQQEDGLLTAYEVTNLNLDSTLLVVLSACETAKGDVSHGEGVYGLQRALRVAGAQNMIMSLWKVDDDATQKLMVDFYARWIKTNDLLGAFREAQKNLRKHYPNPYYWGAFILAR